LGTGKFLIVREREIWDGLRMMRTEWPLGEGREDRTATNRVWGGFARVRFSPA
jgi:hypothetical protein